MNRTLVWNRRRGIAGGLLLALAFAPALAQEGGASGSAPAMNPGDSAATTEKASPRPQLEIRAAGTPDAWVAFGESPAFGYGLSPQNLLTCLPPGEDRDTDLDFRDFAPWAFAHGVTICRSYPPSSRVGPRYLDLFERAAGDAAKFDLARFNDAYFARLREACALMADHSIFVHLQVWQAVTWKKAWDDCYYNPENNVNADLVQHAGPDEFVIDPKRNQALLAHQREYMRRVLESTADLGNVFYDLMNEIGNGTGVSAAWVEAMLDEVEAFEQKTGRNVIIGMNDEGRDRKEAGFSLSNPRFDVAFLDLGRYDEHVDARTKYKRPIFGVRNIDWNPETKQRAYFAGEFDLSINPDSTLASRTRRTFWRLFMAKSQMCSGYADFGRLAYRGTSLQALDLWPFRNLQRIFTNSPWVESYGEMQIDSPIVLESPTPFSYALDSPRASVVYLETTPGTAGAHFEDGKLRIRSHAAIDKVSAHALLTPNALWKPAPAELGADGIGVQLPEFTDDLLVVVAQSADDPPNQGIPEATKLEAQFIDGVVHLAWERNPRGLIARVHRTSQALAAAELIPDLPTLIAGTTALSYIDEACPPGVWQYSVLWKDDPKREILQSNAVVVEVSDTPPLQPEIRPIKVDDDRVFLWAAGNLVPDLAEYEWFRRRPGETEWVSLGITAAPLFEDRDVRRGQPLEYQVKARDFGQLSSPSSQVLSVTPQAAPEYSAASRVVRKAKETKSVALVGAILAGLALGAGFAWIRKSKGRDVRLRGD